MDGLRAAPTAGIATCLLVVSLLLLPYLLVAQGSAVTAYYDAGAITPLAAGLFALAVAAAWALTVPESVVLQLGTAQGSTATVLELHRYLLALAAALVALAGGWYARSLRLL